MPVAIYKHILTISLVYIILSACTISFCRAQQALPQIKILGQNRAFNERSVQFEVSSSSDIYCYVSLEKFIDKRWQEIVLDISADVPGRAARLFQVKKDKPIKSIFKFIKIPNGYTQKGNRYRLKVNYGLKLTRIDKTVASNSFKTF